MSTIKTWISFCGTGEGCFSAASHSQVKINLLLLLSSLEARSCRRRWTCWCRAICFIWIFILVSVRRFKAFTIERHQTSTSDQVANSAIIQKGWNKWMLMWKLPGKLNLWQNESPYYPVTYPKPTPVGTPTWEILGQFALNTHSCCSQEWWWWRAHRCR